MSTATCFFTLGSMEATLPLHLKVGDCHLEPPIEWLVDRVSERTQMLIQTELQGGGGRPPASVELAVSRIAQEAILNATKHGRGPVIVHYEADPMTAWLSVNDAGPGISAAAQEQATREGHLGLALMARRAEAIDVRLEVASLQGGGTRADLRWASA